MDSMKNTSLMLLFILLFIFPDCREKDSVDRSLTLRGRFAAVGGAPFIKLVFRSDDGASYEVAPTEAEKYKNMQGAHLVLEGRVSSLVLKTVDGKYTRKILTLSEIKILDDSPVR
jgi:hypothetical protein